MHAPIRALVISSVGSWVRADPAQFLADTYLKYLGWALSDKVGDPSFRKPFLFLWESYETAGWALSNMGTRAG